MNQFKANVSQELKEKARKADLLFFLIENHPDLITEKNPGQYAYAKDPSITFFKGRDGVYRYCDHRKRLQYEKDCKRQGTVPADSRIYSGDEIEFLKQYVGGYGFVRAVEELARYAEV